MSPGYGKVLFSWLPAINSCVRPPHLSGGKGYTGAFSLTRRPQSNQQIGNAAVKSAPTKSGSLFCANSEGIPVSNDDVLGTKGFPMSQCVIVANLFLAVLWEINIHITVLQIGILLLLVHLIKAILNLMVPSDYNAVFYLLKNRPLESI